jgi:hypothetical protein
MNYPSLEYAKAPLSDILDKIEEVFSFQDKKGI